MIRARPVPDSVKRHPGFPDAGGEVVPLNRFTGMPLALVTCHFNFGGHERPVQNLRRFIRQMEREGVPVFGCEAVAPGGEAVMTDHPRWKVCHVGNHGILFQKEALINAAVRQVPDSFPYIAAIDADVWFDNPNWVPRTIETLDQCPAMQPFEHCVWTDRVGQIELVREASAKAGLDATWCGHPGFAWAFRREFFEAGGLYPWAIIGSGDTATCSGLIDSEPILTVQHGIGMANLRNGVYHEWREGIRRWMGDARCGWIPGRVWHEWHGDRKDRKYAERTKIVAHDYDARRDVRLTEEGWIEWTRHAHPRLMSQVMTYFTDRKEDG